MYNVLTMTAVFQVILGAEEDDNRLKDLECFQRQVHLLYNYAFY